MVDGTGHGIEAAKAAYAAVDYVGSHVYDSLETIFAGCDKALRPTRGAAMGIAVIDEGLEALLYAGINNVRSMIVSRPNSERMEKEKIELPSNFGIVGGGYRHLRIEKRQLHPGDMVILSTDGIKSGFNLNGYDTAPEADLEQLANSIVQDWGRQTDDCAVIIYRMGGSA